MHSKKYSKYRINFYGFTAPILTNNVIKNKSIIEVTRQDLIKILQDLKKKGILETANRTYMLLNKIFKFRVKILNIAFILSFSP